MRTKLFLLVAMIVLTFSIAWVGHAQKENSRWEYTVVHSFSSDNLQSQLNALGASGWQLVSVTEISFGNPGQNNVTLYLKRAR